MIPFNPQPPKRYTEEFLEEGWLWSRSTSGQGNEQQDLWTMPLKPFPLAKAVRIDGVWYWTTDAPVKKPTPGSLADPAVVKDLGKMSRRGEMADATDLKSVISKGVCGFESRRRHLKMMGPTQDCIRRKYPIGTPVVASDKAVKGFILREGDKAIVIGYSQIIPSGIRVLKGKRKDTYDSSFWTV